MIFNSVTFILFLIGVVFLYWVLPKTARFWMLFIASIVFYGFWKAEFLLVMLASAITDYFTAIAIGNTPESNKRRRKWLLAISLIVNLGFLLYFKYLFFFTENFNLAMSALGLEASLPVLKVILPFGISFYTFETISYTVDVYRGLVKPEKSFVIYGLFVTFFPKLVAGPIQRAAELIAQFKSDQRFSWELIGEGLSRILIGLFMKVGLADNISPLVDEMFAADPQARSAIDVWTMAFMFGFQIYFDFSAYSHIAVGSAKLMGIYIPENFNFPYAATSFKDFWKRWHISLSSWIRDYLYLPLTGVKVVQTTGTGGIGESLNNAAPSQQRRNTALFLTWAIMGLWHGANWTFVIWGVYHSLIIFLERMVGSFKDKRGWKTGAISGWLVTLPLAMLGWIPFRAQNVNEVMTLWSKIFQPSAYLHLGFRENNYLIMALLLLITTLAYLADRWLKPWLDKNLVAGYLVHTLKYAFLLIIIFTFLRPISQFIYFQF